MQKFLSDIIKEVDNAKNEFLANHDAMTECLNKQAFDRTANSVVLKMLGKASSGSGAPLLIGSGSELRIFFLSIDLDHFKSTNDNFGHLYGDLVLRVFSWRLQEAMDGWIEDLEEDVVAHVARPGGEEFQIIISGSVEEASIKALAEQIRIAISNKVLPTIDEFKVVQADGRSQVAYMPDDIDRRVTISIGISEVTKSSTQKICRILNIKSFEASRHCIVFRQIGWQKRMQGILRNTEISFKNPIYTL